MLTTYHGGPDDIDKWMTCPIVRILRLLECMNDDAKEIKKATGKGQQITPDEAMIEMMKKRMMQKKKQE